MEEVVWFDSKPGQKVARIERGALAPGEANAVIMYDGVPDHVVVPKELGGGEYRVLDWKQEACPHPDCQEDVHAVLHLLVRERDMLCVAGCTRHGWCWYTLELPVQPPEKGGVVL